MTKLKEMEKKPSTVAVPVHAIKQILALCNSQTRAIEAARAYLPAPERKKLHTINACIRESLRAYIQLSLF